MNRATLESLWTQYPHARSSYVRLVGVRGYNAGACGNQMGIYDDVIVRIIGSAYAEFIASTDPGKPYLSEPLNPAGCAVLKPGLWWYERGMHKDHAALIQAIPFQVWRLRYENQVLVQSDDSGWLGLNMHSGGAGPDVGRFSAGCQVIRSSDPWGEGWQEFFKPIVEAMQDAHQLTVPYLLVNAEQIKRDEPITA